MNYINSKIHISNTSNKGRGLFTMEKISTGEDMVAMREIGVGEELTYDYAMTDSGNYDMECKCDSKNCRKRIRGDDWMIPEIQKRYKGYFQKNIQDKINTLKMFPLI